MSAPAWSAGRGLWAYRTSQAVLRLLFTGFVRRHLYGTEHLRNLSRRRGVFLLAPDHISHFDGPLLAMTVGRMVDWLVVAKFFSPPPLGWWMRQCGGVPVRYGARFTGTVGTVRDARRRLAAGRPLGIFPDGGIRTGVPSVLEGGRPLRGVAWLAVRDRVPVLPCVILGTDRLYARGNWRPGRGRVPVWIGFGPAIEPHEWPDDSPNLYISRMQALYAEMRAEFQLKPDDLPTTAQRRWAQANIDR